jgi:hypothetical protein
MIPVSSFLGFPIEFPWIRKNISPQKKARRPSLVYDGRGFLFELGTYYLIDNSRDLFR